MIAVSTLTKIVNEKGPLIIFNIDSLKKKMIIICNKNFPFALFLFFTMVVCNLVFKTLKFTNKSLKKR